LQSSIAVGNWEIDLAMVSEFEFIEDKAQRISGDK
jgi:hypothetical protein